MRQFEIGLVLMLVVIFVMPVSRACAEEADEEKSIELGQIEV